MDLSRDAIINVWTNGIRRDISVLLEHKGFRGACMLTLAGVDAMAFLDMPETQTDVGRDDFVRWVDRYLGLKGVTGLELYAARCAFLHAYSTESRLSREGKCRQVLWCDRMLPAVKSHPAHPDLVMIGVEQFAQCFFDGAEAFFVSVFASPARAALANKRLQMIVHHLPVEDDANLSGTP